MPLGSAAATAKVAHARLKKARELEERWEQLSEEDKAPLREDWSRLKATMKAVEERLTYGVRGFFSEFKAASRGEGSTLADPQPLGDAVKDLGDAVSAMRASLDALETPQDQQDH